MVRVAVSERDLDYLASVHEVDSGSQGLARQPGLEATAIDLVARDGQKVTGAALEPAGDVPVSIVAHEEAQPKLAELVAEQVRESEDFTEVVASGFDGRFADLVRGLGRRMFAAFRDENADFGPRLLELECEAKAREAPACDHNVVSVANTHVAMRGRR